MLDSIAEAAPFACPLALSFATVIAADPWFIQLALVDLKSGRTTRLPGDGTSEVVSAAWTRDGQILALKQGMDATIWTFTRNGQ